MNKNFWTSLLIILSIVFNAVPAAAQSGGLKANIKLTAKENPSETFRGLYRTGNFAFARLLKKTSGGESIVNALETQSVEFFEKFQAATEKHLDEVVEKARQAKDPKNPRPGVKTAPATKMPIRSGDNGSNLFDERYFSNQSAMGVRFTNASYSPNFSHNGLMNFALDEPQVTVTETATGKTATATSVKTLDTGDAAGTLTITSDKKVNFSDNTMSTETIYGEKTEVFSRVDGTKVTKTFKMTIGSSFDVCPDAQGIVRGKGKMLIYSQTTSIKGKEIAALTDEKTAQFQITGYVNEAAVFTHFDMEGVAAEKSLGYDRAVRIGALDDSGGITDGSKSVVYTFSGNTPPTETRDFNGNRDWTNTKFSTADVKSFNINTDEELERVDAIGKLGILSFMAELELIMKSSISSWRNGECVAVECTAPKTALKPSESIEVTAVTTSKLDSGKINADLTVVADETATPEKQKGTPTAVYTLTAPQKGKAYIGVTSTSKRGIGLGSLEIPVETVKKQPPVKNPPPKKNDCDQGWTGTVKAVRTKRADKTKPASGRLVRQVESVNETYSVNINVLGTRDLSGGIVTNFHGNAEVNYLSTEYREFNYAAGKMSCGNGIINSPETRKLELQTKGDEKGQIIVTISVIGNWGHISFTPPELQAERIRTDTYETNCPAYNAANSGTGRSDDSIDIIQTGFEIEFDVDPSKPNVIEGSKTVQESDGSETTYTWNLARCQ